MGQLGEFEQMVLFSVLRLGDEAYGLAIRDVIKDQTGRTVSSGAVYTTLGRLEERRLIESSVGSPVPGRAGRPRKYYRLKPSGAKALMDAYTTQKKMADGLIPTLADLAES